MMIDEFRTERITKNANEDKEIKVRISREYHVRLHTMKVVARANISETIKLALEQYFEEIGMAARTDAQAALMPAAAGTARTATPLR
ncbi:MAG: hypothetical protein ACYDCK_09030 [Thermoplasmatota archaeon]